MNAPGGRPPPPGAGAVSAQMAPATQTAIPTRPAANVPLQHHHQQQHPIHPQAPTHQTQQQQQQPGGAPPPPPQAIQPIYMKVIVVVDGTGKMGPHFGELLTSYVQPLTQSLLNRKYGNIPTSKRFGVVVFGDHKPFSLEIVEKKVFTSHFDRFFGTLEKLKFGGGSLNSACVGDGLLAALDLLVNDKNEKSLLYCILVSNSLPYYESCSSTVSNEIVSLKQIIEQLKNADVNLSVISPRSYCSKLIDIFQMVNEKKEPKTFYDPPLRKPDHVVKYCGIDFDSEDAVAKRMKIEQPVISQVGIPKQSGVVGQAMQMPTGVIGVQQQQPQKMVPNVPMKISPAHQQQQQKQHLQQQQQQQHQHQQQQLLLQQQQLQQQQLQQQQLQQQLPQPLPASPSDVQYISTTTRVAPTTTQTGPIRSAVPMQANVRQKSVPAQYAASIQQQQLQQQQQQQQQQHVYPQMQNQPQPAPVRPQSAPVRPQQSQPQPVVMVFSTILKVDSLEIPVDVYTNAQLVDLVRHYQMPYFVATGFTKQMLTKKIFRLMEKNKAQSQMLLQQWHERGEAVVIQTPTAKLFLKSEQDKNRNYGLFGYLE